MLILIQKLQWKKFNLLYILNSIKDIYKKYIS